MDASKYRKQYTEELGRAAAKKADYRDFLDKSKPASKRLKALKDRTGLRTEDELTDSVNLIRDQEEDPEIRASALRAIGRDIGNSHELMDMVLALLRDEAEPREVRISALQVLQMLGFTSPGFASWRPEYLAALRSIVDDKDTRVRQQAIQILALLKDEYVQRRLREGLEKPSKALVSPEKAIQLLGQDIHAGLYPLLKKIIKRPPNPAAKEEAVRLLAGDPASKELLIGLLNNKRQPIKIRTLSAVALQSLAPSEFTEQAKQIVTDDTEDYRLRLTSLSGLTHFADPTSLKRDPEFNEHIQQLRDKSTSMQLRDAAARYLKHRK
jgi:HEAT repeat protein